MLTCARQRLDTRNGPSRRALGTLHVVVGLEVQPKLMRRVEEPRQPECRICADAATLAFEALAIEGGLLSADWLARVAQLLGEPEKL